MTRMARFEYFAASLDTVMGVVYHNSLLFAIAIILAMIAFTFDKDSVNYLDV